MKEFFLPKHIKISKLKWIIVRIFGKRTYSCDKTKYGKREIWGRYYRKCFYIIKEKYEIKEVVE